MVVQLQPDNNIPLSIYQQVSLANIGTPVRAFRNTLLRIMASIFLFLGGVSLAYLLYMIYAYFNFISLTHIYPNIVDIPSNQLDYYSWMEVLHENFWYSILQVSSLLLASSRGFSSFGVGFRTKIYICTEGLLKIEKGKMETVRWDQIQGIHTNRGNITTLERKDKSTFNIPVFFYRQQANKKLSILIGDEITKVRLPQLLAQFDQGETISIGTLEVNKKGIYKPDSMLPWNAVGAIDFDQGHLKIYGYQVKHVFAKKALIWNEWVKDSALLSHPPDLPLFTALINTILEREPDSIQQQRITHWKTIAFKEKQTKKKRLHLLIISSIILTLCLFAALIYSLLAY